MSKNFQLPDFKTSTIEKKTDLGLLDRKFSIKRDKSPNDRNLKQFYLSHHSELMATKSVSKVHRRQDRVLTKDHLDFMVSSKQIPVVSARVFKNINENETPIKF